jgi:hypothetical protein
MGNVHVGFNYLRSPGEIRTAGTLHLRTVHKCTRSKSN